MDGIYLGLLVLAGIATLLVRRRQQQPLTLTNHSLHCPAYDGQASVAVRTDAEASGPRGEPIRCTSGMSDSYELARQTQTPAIMRAMWYHSV